MTGDVRTAASEGLRVSLSASAILVAALAAGGCASSAPAEDDWSRSYVSSFERVFEAALASLEANDFYLDSVDAEGGRIRARSSARRGDEVTLVVRVEERSPAVRVDVMAQGATAVDGRAPTSMSAAVDQFLNGLDDRLQGRSD